MKARRSTRVSAGMMASQCARMVALLTLVLAGPLAAQEIVIGVAGPMSGPLAEAGKAIAAGARLAAADINARGGLDKIRITLRVEDDGGSVDGARRAAQTFAAANIRIAAGHYTSAPATAANEIYARHGMLLIAPAATSARLNESAGTRVLRLAPREDAQGAFAGEIMALRFGKAPLAVVRDMSASSIVLAAAAVATMQARGLDAPVILDLPVQDAPAQAARQAQTLLQRNIVALYFAGGAVAAIPFLRALHATQSQAQIYAGDMLAAPEFAAAAGDVLDGLRMVMPADHAATGAAGDIVARLKAEGVRDFNLALAQYAALQVFTEAARRAGSVEPEQLARAMRGGAAVETLVGPVSFDAKGERRESPFAVVVWKKAPDGKFVFAPE